MDFEQSRRYMFFSAIILGREPFFRTSCRFAYGRAVWHHYFFERLKIVCRTLHVKTRDCQKSYLRNFVTDCSWPIPYFVIAQYFSCFQIMLMFLLPVILIYLERHLRMSLYAVLLRTFKYALLTSVLISFPWTWFRIYQVFFKYLYLTLFSVYTVLLNFRYLYLQEKVAEQQRLLFEKSQAHCKEIGAGQILLRSVQNWFKIIPDSSPCSQYYRAINVHPFLDVPPTMVYDL